MTLAELTAGTDIRRVIGSTAGEIAGLAYDSRQVMPGDLFFSTARDPAAAREYSNQALNRGARAVVVKNSDGVAVRSWKDDDTARSAGTILECDQPRRLMGVVASRFFGAPSRQLDLVGITGTSGKTTTAYLLRSIFEAAGRRAGMIGTIGTFAADRKLASGLTTPESIDFEAALASMRTEGIDAVAAEISSIGLEEHRVDELSFRAAVFTNLGRDHLDYHGTPEKYFAAKQRLFVEILPHSSHDSAVAVINTDDPYGRTLAASIKLRQISFGLGKNAEVRAVDATFGSSGIKATIDSSGRRFEITSSLLGEINLRNILGASALSVALGIETDAVVEGVRRCPGAPGRLEAVPGPAGVKVLIDYAHKPEALQAVLETLRSLRPKRLFCVFGCGGDRDRGKRPLMGEIAGRTADLVIVTSDNPRSEEPRAIITEIEHGLRTTQLIPVSEGQLRTAAAGYLIEPDRRGAIALALRSAQPGDLVLIAGKGHEDYQLIGNTRLEFDDATVVRELTAAIRG
jgi:UDP-N-acetylmuramoyl-L-alanyl-D-glutamate--2,6-diaminopimelate ligase